ncbi:TPA: hypothetical protein ROY01_004115 [Bacillus toyonensis]|nr:hypothetical protein [Bacillus toyonensis]
MKILIFGQIVPPNIYRFKVEIKHTDGKIGIFYTDAIELKNWDWWSNKDNKDKKATN